MLSTCRRHDLGTFAVVLQVLRGQGRGCAPSLTSTACAQTPDVAPAAVARHISADASAGGATPEPWPPDLLQALAAAAQRVLRAAPSAAPSLLGCASAVAAASPSAVQARPDLALGILQHSWYDVTSPGTNKVGACMMGCLGVQADVLFSLWSTAASQGATGKSAAFSAALQLLSAPQWPHSAPRPPTGAYLDDACMSVKIIKLCKLMPLTCYVQAPARRPWQGRLPMMRRGRSCSGAPPGGWASLPTRLRARWRGASLNSMAARTLRTLLKRRAPG